MKTIMCSSRLKLRPFLTQTKGVKHHHHVGEARAVRLRVSVEEPTALRHLARQEIFGRTGRIESAVARAGATLSEVLISLLVMSIGVVSLATLFPISVLRSLQATQLTSAANLRYNVEAYLGVNPKLYTIGSPWQRSTKYDVGDLATPTGCCTDSIVLYCTVAGTSATVEPTWNTNNGATTTDGSVTWQTYRLLNYVVDPLGKHLVETNYRQTTNGDYFGYNPATNLPIQVLRAFPGAGTLNTRIFFPPNDPNTPTYYGFIVDDAIAADLAMLSDSWISQAESTSVSYALGATVCTLGDIQSDLTQTTPTIPQFGSPPSPAQIAVSQSRIVFFDITGNISHTRPITEISGSITAQKISWKPPPFTPGSPPTGQIVVPALSGPLPRGFIPVRARVETKERRYTWLLSVRRSGDSFEMEVVVFFRRPFSGRDERVFPATFTGITDLGYDQKPGVAGFDDDDNGTDDDASEIGYVGTDDTARNWVVLQYDGTSEKPFVKKGGYVTDADNLRWYRILDAYESDTPANAMTKAGLNRPPLTTTYTPDAVAFGANTQTILLRVENKIIKSGPQPSGGAGGVPTGGAILMRNIIDVYPIRTRVISESQ